MGGTVYPVAGRVDVVGHEDFVHILCRAVVGLHKVPAHLAGVALSHLPRVGVAHGYLAGTAARTG